MVRARLPLTVTLIALALFAGLAAAVQRLSVGIAERAVAVGRQPTAIAVDARTRHVLVVSSGDDALRLLDETGALLAGPIDLGQSPGPVAVDERTSRAFAVADGNTGVRVLDTRTGRVLRTVSVSAAGQPALAVDEPAGRVFLTGDDGLIVLDARSGALLRAIALGSAPNALAALAVDDAAGRVFVADHDAGGVIMLDARDGRVLRTIRVGRGPVTLAVDGLTGRGFAVDADDYTLSVFDTRQGAAVRTVRVDPGPLAADERRGRVFVATDAGSGCAGLHILDAVTGRVLRTVCTGPTGASPSAVAVDERSGRVFVASEGGVGVYDAQSGALLRIPPLDIAAAAGLAVDERSGRAFVIGQQGDNGGQPGDETGPAAWAQLLWQRFPWLPHPPLSPSIPPGTGIMGVLDAAT